MTTHQTIEQTLDQRGSRYGEFRSHAEITQHLKHVMRSTPGWDNLAPDMLESLEMIAHKIGRILNGDPTWADSWHDIAGYALLVAIDLDKDAAKVAVITEAPKRRSRK